MSMLVVYKLRTIAILMRVHKVPTKPFVQKKYIKLCISATCVKCMSYVHAHFHKLAHPPHYAPLCMGCNFGLQGKKGYKLELFATDTISTARLHPFVTIATLFILPQYRGPLTLIFMIIFHHF